ncbi:unnamed protein product [Arctogadus glacialis]
MGRGGLGAPGPLIAAGGAGRWRGPMGPPAERWVSAPREDRAQETDQDATGGAIPTVLTAGTAPPWPTMPHGSTPQIITIHRRCSFSAPTGPVSIRTTAELAMMREAGGLMRLDHSSNGNKGSEKSLLSIPSLAEFPSAKESGLCVETAAGHGSKEKRPSQTSRGQPPRETGSCPWVLTQCTHCGVEAERLIGDRKGPHAQGPLVALGVHPILTTGATHLTDPRSDLEVSLPSLCIQKWVSVGVCPSGSRLEGKVKARRSEVRRDKSPVIPEGSKAKTFNQGPKTKNVESIIRSPGGASLCMSVRPVAPGTDHKLIHHRRGPDGPAPRYHGSRQHLRQRL